MSDSAPKFPASLQAAYDSYIQRPKLTRELLIARVRKYTDTVMQASKENQLDLGTAGELGMALLRLLRECTDSELMYVQAAVLYFIESEDEEPDLSSPDGFQDDAEFFNCVCTFIGRDDILI